MHKSSTKYSQTKAYNTIKGLHTMIKWDSSLRLEESSIHTQVENVTFHINKMQDIKLHGSLKRLRKEENTQHLFTLEMLNKLSTEILQYGKVHMWFEVISGAKQGVPLSLLLYTIILEFPVRTVGQEKEIKGIQLGKEEVSLTLFSNDMNIHRENTKNKIPPMKSETNL